MTENWITHETLAVADAVVLLAVGLAVAAFTNCSIHSGHLVRTRFDCRLPFIVLAARALANARLASCTILQADAVQLMAGAFAAVASHRLICCRR